MKKKPASSSSVQKRYSQEDLKEFEAIILEKLEKARAAHTYIRAGLDGKASNDIVPVSNKSNMYEEGEETLAREQLSQLALRQERFISQLESALVRIKNSTYGVCIDTGKLIPKERLYAVPHTMHSIEAKQKK